MSKCCKSEECKNKCTCTPIPGAPGTPGTSGTTFRKDDYGGLPPSDTIGIDGDVAVDISDGKYYQKASGTWGSSYMQVSIKDSSGRVGIGTDTPDSDAMLDIVSGDKGVLIPRITTASRTGIASPPTGLVVYDKDLNKFFYWDSAVWKEISTSVVANTNFAEDNLSLTGDRSHDFVTNAMLLKNARGLALGSLVATLDASALFELSSTTKGFLTPRMTTLQRLAITPADGLIVYDTDLKSLFVYNNTSWKNATVGDVTLYESDGDLSGNRILSGAGAYYLQFGSLAYFRVLVDVGAGKTGDYVYTPDGFAYEFSGGTTMSSQAFTVDQSGFSFGVSHGSLLSASQYLIKLTNAVASGDVEFRINALGQLVLGALGATPHVSALVDLQSTTKGFLVPRMTGAQVEAIATPATGLQVYATNAGSGDVTAEGWWAYDGSNWVQGYSGGSGTVTSITPAADSGSGTAITTSGTLTTTGGNKITSSVSGTATTIDWDGVVVQKDGVDVQTDTGGINFTGTAVTSVTTPGGTLPTLEVTVDKGASYYKNVTLITSGSVSASATDVAVPSLTFTIPAGKNGDYVVYAMISVDIDNTDMKPMSIMIFKNGSKEDYSETMDYAKKNENQSIQLTYSMDGLVATDVIAVYVNNDNVDITTIHHGRLLLQSWNT